MEPAFPASGVRGRTDEMYGTLKKPKKESSRGAQQKFHVTRKKFTCAASFYMMQAGVYHMASSEKSATKIGRDRMALDSSVTMSVMEVMSPRSFSTSWCMGSTSLHEWTTLP